MGGSVFRLIYRKREPHDDGSEKILNNFDIMEVSFNGESLSCVKRGKFEFDADGIPLLTLEILPTDIEIDGEAIVRIATETREATHETLNQY